MIKHHLIKIARVGQDTHHHLKTVLWGGFFVFGMMVFFGPRTPRVLQFQPAIRIGLPSCLIGFYCVSIRNARFRLAGSALTILKKSSEKTTFFIFISALSQFDCYSGKMSVFRSIIEPKT